MTPFMLSSHTIDAADCKARMLNPDAGAFVQFEGWVRRHNQGREVVALEYEAYEELCRGEAEAIFKETRRQFEINAAAAVHRRGKLSVGEMAVWVGVSAVHRDAAFAACRYIIDHLKQRLPIWKKEYYRDGDSGWVHCEGCAPSVSS